MERPQLPADRHGRRRHRRPEPDHALRSPSRRAPRSRRPTSSSSSSTRARGSRPATRSSRRSCARRRSTCSCSRTRSTTRAGEPRARVPPARPRRAVPDLGAARLDTGDLLDEIVDLLPGESARTVGRGGDPRRHPRPAERRQVVALQRARRQRAHDRLGGARHDARHDRHGDRARRAHVPARRHGRPAPQAQAAAGHRVLLGAARARGGRARRRRARADRRGRGDRRGRHHRRRGGAQGAVRDAGRPLEVGHLARSRSRTSAPSSQRRLRQRPHFITVSSLTGRGVSRLLGKVAELYDRYVSRVPTAELNKFIAELKEMRQAPSKGVRRLNLLYGAQVTIAPAALPVHRQRPGARHARLRLLGREPAARALQPRGRAGGDRLPRTLMRVVVVGGGAWGARSRGCCADRGHDVFVADPGDARRRAVRGGRSRRASPCRAARSARCSDTCAAPRRCSA